MPLDNCSSKSSYSEIATLFAHRVSGNTDAWTTISELVATMREKYVPSSVTRLEDYLSHRNIAEVVYRSHLDCDGFIQPLGSDFRSGFQIVLNRSMSAARVRFTLAHELCHTFFYEHVPELKFIPHECEEAEEKLCNFGAAELLMPRKLLCRMAKTEPVCLRSLQGLADAFAVSTRAMLVRLRSLRLWNADLSFWTRSSDGEFVWDERLSTCGPHWRWTANELAGTWEHRRPSNGKTFIERIDEKGCRRLRPICYDMRCMKDGVEVLWGTWAASSDEGDATLFARTTHQQVEQCARSLLGEVQA